MLRNDAFVKTMMNALLDNAFMCHTPITNLLRRPKFRKMREVHAARARKLRRRGEHVHFLRWEHGHCIYGWSGPVPETFVINRMPRKKSEPVYTPMKITASTIAYGVDWGYCMTSMGKAP
jgi:hypothetical protein